MRHRRAHIAINGSGAGKHNLGHPVAAHGFKDVVRGDGFLFEIQPRVVNSPTGIGVGRQMKNPIDVPKVRQYFFEVQKIKSFHAQSPVLCVPRDMLPPSRGKIIQHPDFPRRGLRKESIQQMRADETRAPGDQIC